MNEYTILDYTTINHTKVFIGYKDKTIATWLLINHHVFNIRFYSNIHIADNDYYNRIASITVCA